MLDRAHFVYVLAEAGGEDAGPTKIGTATNVAYRVDSLRGGNPRRLVIIETFALPSRDRALAVERAVKDSLTCVAVGRDWLVEGSATVLDAIRKVLNG